MENLESVEEINNTTVQTAPTQQPAAAEQAFQEVDEFSLEKYDNILDLDEKDYPQFTLAKNKARFLRMVTWYRGKEEWIQVAPLSGVNKLFKQQTKELEGIRANKMDYDCLLYTSDAADE